MREVTRQIAGLTNELESLLPRDRYIRDRPTNAPPAGCSDDENWRSQGDEIASKSLATGSCFPTNLVILPGGSRLTKIGIGPASGFPAQTGSHNRGYTNHYCFRALSTPAPIAVHRRLTILGTRNPSLWAFVYSANYKSLFTIFLGLAP